MKSKSMSFLPSLLTLLTQTITINMNLVGKFKVRPIAGHEPDWNNATSKIHRPRRLQGLEDFVHVFGKLTTPYVMFESKRNSNRQKKFPQGLERFVRVFGKLTTPYVMFEIKFLLNSQIEPKKVQLAGKKSSPRVQSISHRIFAVGHPLCDV